MADLDSSLADVRRAYRLIWGYQRRVMDLTQLIVDGFSSHEFYAWAPLSFARPSQLTTNALKKWAWDGLPFYKVTFLYLPTGADSTQLKKGDWLLELTVDSDTVDFSSIRGEPDASKFPDATSTGSTLKMVGWKCTEEINANWFRDVWGHGEWPPSDGEPFTQPNYPIVSSSLTTALQDLPTREAVLLLVDKFKEQLLHDLQIKAD